jgi:predicted HTH domain antitoxin
MRDGLSRIVVLSNGIQSAVYKKPFTGPYSLESQDKSLDLGYFRSMETEHLVLPAALLKAADLDNTHLSEEAARLLAVELFREDKVSLGRAAELSRTPLAAFTDFVAKRGVPPLRYTFEDLEEERRSTERLGV